MDRTRRWICIAGAVLVAVSAAGWSAEPVPAAGSTWVKPAASALALVEVDPQDRESVVRLERDVLKPAFEVKVG